jgi:hypothetical protein
VRQASPAFTFTAKLVRFRSFYGIDVPATVSRAIGVRGFVPIVGALRGVPFRSSLMPVGKGRHRLWLNADLRTAARVTAGARVAIELRVDRTPPPHLHSPADLAEALHEEGVFETFESLAPGRRRQLLKWLEAAVHEATRAKRVARCIEVALAEREKRLDREGGLR